jgi:peptidoglycan/LPS O-acetylase OafA/YrhL
VLCGLQGLWRQTFVAFETSVVSLRCQSDLMPTGPLLNLKQAENRHSMSSPSQNRLGHIDSIRGIAALLVLFQHSAARFVELPGVEERGTLIYEVSHYLAFGTIGVIAFFAISGFVICPSLKGERGSGARRFAISRFFRLYPAFWIAILFCVLSDFVLRGVPVNWAQVLGNIPMLYSLSGVKPLTGLFWTLEVEFGFYLLCLVLFLSGRLHKPQTLFFTGLLLLTIGEFLLNRPEYRSAIRESLNAHWVSMPKYMAIMFWGGLFRAWYENRQGFCLFFGYQIPTIVFVVALLFLILLRPLTAIDLWLYKGQFYQLGAALPIVLGLGLFVVGAIYIKLENRFLVRLGAISYSIYLLHPPVVHTVKYFVINERLIPGDMHLVMYVLICAVLTIILADLVYRMVEKPAIQIGRYFIDRTSGMT